MTLSGIVPHESHIAPATQLMSMVDIHITCQPQHVYRWSFLRSSHVIRMVVKSPVKRCFGLARNKRLKVTLAWDWKIKYR